MIPTRPVPAREAERPLPVRTVYAGWTRARWDECTLYATDPDGREQVVGLVWTEPGGRVSAALLGPTDGAPVMRRADEVWWPHLGRARVDRWYQRLGGQGDVVRGGPHEPQCPCEDCLGRLPVTP